MSCTLLHHLLNQTFIFLGLLCFGWILVTAPTLFRSNMAIFSLTGGGSLKVAHQALVQARVGM
jgi:hypothetical protein